MSTPEVKEEFPICTWHRKVSLGSKREWAPPNNKCGHAPIGLCGGIHPRKKLHVHLEEDPQTGQM